MALKMMIWGCPMCMFVYKRQWARDHLKSFKSAKKANLQKLSYDEVWNTVLNRKAEPGMIPGAFVDWDNTPRYKEKGRVLTGATPEKFKEYFGKQLKRARDEYKSDYIFIFAWNEWSEGGYLEPDMKNQYGYLDAIKKALEDLNE